MPMQGQAAAWPAAFVLALLAQPALATAAKPRPRGHFLTNSELGDIDTIACLKARQRNPGLECKSLEVNRTEFTGELSPGNYPNYKDRICGSNGEYFCDPSGVFAPEDRLKITAELQRLRRASPVTCPSIQPDPVDSTHLQPFYLGVVIAKDWPLAESDPESLQQLGQIIESQWNMNELYVGKPIPSHKCANTAVLIVMADKRLAYLSSGSCQLICQAQAGSVISRTLASLDSSGAVAGVMSGMEEVYRVASTREASTAASSSSVQSKEPPQAKHDQWLNGVLQAAYIIAVVLVVGTVLFAAVVFLLVPGFIAARRKNFK